MINTIIADDEKHARERLRVLLERFEIFNIVAEATNGNDAIQMIIMHKPDVAFLDINMPGINIFESIQSLRTPPVIVFQTAYSEYAASAYEINAIDYLLKPLRFERLEKTVAKIREKLSSVNSGNTQQTDQPFKPTDQIAVTVGGKTRLIQFSDIIRISFEDGFCYMYTSSEKLISDKYLNYYEDKLKNSFFFRTSRTDLINLNHISLINKETAGVYTIQMKNGASIDLSRRKAMDLRKIIDF